MRLVRTTASIGQCIGQGWGRLVETHRRNLRAEPSLTSLNTSAIVRLVRRSKLTLALGLGIVVAMGSAQVRPPSWDTVFHKNLEPLRNS